MSTSSQLNADRIVTALRRVLVAGGRLVTDPKELAADFVDDKSPYAPGTAIHSAAPPRTIGAAAPSEASAAAVPAFHPLPIAAAVPKTVDEVVSIVRVVCVQHRTPLTVRGAGSGLEGGCVPLRGGVVLDTSDLTSIQVDEFEGTCWVGAGVRKLHLGKALAKLGLVFGPDPASNPSVGGMVSTSGSGMSTIKYGTTRENIVSLRVVTPQGELVETRKAVRKASTGLELTHLYCGAEGTLGVIVEVCVRVHRLPKLRTGALINFPSIGEATQAVVAVRQEVQCASLVKCELLNPEAIDAGNKEFKTQLALKPTILIELQDDSIEVMRREFAALVAVFTRHGADRQTIDFRESGADLDQVWEARRGCVYASRSFRGRKKPDSVVITDVCVPMKHLAECIKQTEDDFKANGVPCIICAHIADGNFHVLVPFGNAEEKEKVHHLEGRLVERAIRCGGAVSGEHGIGQGKVKHVLKEHGRAHLEVQYAIKKALDPHNLMNPGKFYFPLETIGGPKL